MEKAVPPPATKSTQTAAIQRLVLAGSAAGALATLCWAALQVRAARAEAAQLRERLMTQNTITSSAADRHAGPADFERLLQETEAQHRLAKEKSAAREKELESIISFLRQEIVAAQQTIERLGNLPPASGRAEDVEVRTPAVRDRPERKRQP